MTVLGAAALGGGKAPGREPVGLPRGSVTDGGDTPGLGSPADGVVPAGAGRWLGAVAVAAFGCAGGTVPAGGVVVATGLPGAPAGRGGPPGVPGTGSVFACGVLGCGGVLACGDVLACGGLAGAAAWGGAAALPAGAVAAGLGAAFGVTTPGATLAPAGGAPGVPGAGGVLACGSVVACGSVLACGSLPPTGGCAVVAGATLAGVGAAIPGLAVGWMVALGGIGTLPCWIRAARWTTACGTAGPAGLARPATAGARFPTAGAAPGGGAGGRLITVLMTVVLWMFW